MITSLQKQAIALAMSFVFFVTSRAPAALIAYEGFDYTAGTSVAGQTGGAGWTNAWTAGTTANFIGTNTPDGLSYTDINGVSLQTNGGSLIVGSPAGNSATTATPNRVLNSNLSGGPGITAGPGGTVWISFLYKRLNLSPGTLPFLRQANFGLFEGSGERMDVAGPNTSATVTNVLSVWGNGSHNGSAPFQAPGYPIQQGVTYFILMKVVTDGTATPDTAYVWFNWTNLMAEPDVSTATLVQNEVNLSSVNTLRFQAGNLNANGSNACFQVDELRVGTTFPDVTPQTATVIGPSITLQPVDQAVIIGTTATFSTTASGSLPLSYQWYFNTNTPVGGNSNVLAIASVTTNDVGNYFVVIANSAGSITSSVAALTVVPPIPAGIVTQPLSRTVIIGDSAPFAVVASGTAPLSYQWYLNTNTVLSGATNASFAIASATTNDAGNYSVIVTNLYGSVTSTVVTLTVIPPFEQLPAFPGADGAARYVTGGRGGIVYHVTQLDQNFNDTRQGGLRYGLTDTNFPAGVPRTIVFDVAGVFWLGRYGAESNYDNGWDTSSRYNLPANVTVAGQTAPGPVIIMGGVTKGGNNNIIVRNVTFAPGYGMREFHTPPTPPTPGTFPDSYAYDSIDVNGQNIMLDHLTCIYSTDENISCGELTFNLTAQYCNISQGQNFPQRDAEATNISYDGHALAQLLQAGSNAKISMINNLYAHERGRLPRVGSEVGTGALNDFRNNVYYNWQSTAGTGASGQPSFNNFINNYYLAGPGGDGPVGGANSNLVSFAGGTGIFSGIDAAATRVYRSGNVKDINKNGNPTDLVVSADADYVTITTLPTANNVNIGLTLTATDSFTNVLRHVGSRWWMRPYDFTLGNTNAISTNDIALYEDERLIKETVTGTGKIIAWADDPFNDDPAEGVEWRALLALRADPVTGAAPFNRPANWDTDGDGMPDAWEIEHGLDPNVPNNNGDFDNDGYTDLEEYLNDVAAWPAPGVISFNNTTNNRYAQIVNWSVTGVMVNIAGTNTVTLSRWQPSRYDTAIISNQTCIVDAVGQHAGILRLATNAVLSITNGWLNVADTLDIGAGCTVAVQYSGALKVTNSIVNNGTLRLTGATGLTVGGTITNNGLLDVMTWRGALPAIVNNGIVLDASLVKVGSASLDGTNFVVMIQGYTGHNYQLQCRDDLVSGSWQDVGAPVAGSGVPIFLTHSEAVVQKRFYRVAVSP